MINQRNWLSCFARKQNLDTPSLQCLERYCCLQLSRTRDLKKVNTMHITKNLSILANGRRMVDKRQSLRLRWTIVFKTNLSVNDDEKIWVNFLYISCDLGIAIYFTLEFGKHLFHFCFLHYYCLGITRKLCEQLSTYPSNDPTTLNLWLRIQSFGCKKTCFFFPQTCLLWTNY